MAAVSEFIGLDARTFAGLPMPLTLRLPVKLTDLELERFSRCVEPYQVEKNAQGELEIMTPVGGSGSRGESYLIRSLDLWAEENGGASFSSQGGFNLPDGSTRMADAAWVKSERWDGLSREEQTSFPPLCPDFVVELLSESDSRKKLEAKMEMWVANGARLAWMIDPFAATVSVYQPGQAVEVLERPEVVEAHAVVAGFRLEMARLWAS